MEKRILEAFGIEREGIPIEGGQNEARLYGDIVLKPVDDALYYSQVSTIFNSIQPSSYRISRPIKTKSGEYVAYGFGATKYEPGYNDPTTLREKIQVTRALNKDLAEIKITELPVTEDQWTKANNVLWRNQTIPEEWPDKIKSFFLDLMRKFEPIKDDYQIIHGDPGGNILFHETLKPLVIDFSPTIAPAKYAEAILVCDSIAWSGNRLECLNLLGDLMEYRPYLQRAIVFRVLVVAFTKEREWDEIIGEWLGYEKIWSFLEEV
jgi:hypothetical protein